MVELLIKKRICVFENYLINSKRSKNNLYFIIYSDDILKIYFDFGMRESKNLY